MGDQVSNMSDDEWQDEDALEVPKYIAVARVLDDFIPETNEHLTLIRDDLVYVFKKDVPGKGLVGGRDQQRIRHLSLAVCQGGEGLSQEEEEPRLQPSSPSVAPALRHWKYTQQLCT